MDYWPIEPNLLRICKTELFDIYSIELQHKKTTDVGFFFSNSNFFDNDKPSFTWINAETSNIMKFIRTKRVRCYELETKSLGGISVYLIIIVSDGFHQNEKVGDGIFLPLRMRKFVNLIFDDPEPVSDEYLCFFSRSDRDAFFCHVSATKTCVVCGDISTVCCEKCNTQYCGINHRTIDWQTHQTICKCLYYLL